MSDPPKLSQVIIDGNNPMNFSNCPKDDLGSLEDYERTAVEAAGSTVFKYILSAAELLGEKYSRVRDLAPAYLRSPGKVLVACCRDGLVIRFESGEKPDVCVGWSNEGFADIVAKLSQDVVYCHSGGLPETLPSGGRQITLFAQSPDGVRKDMVGIKVGFDAVIQLPERSSDSPNKPFCLFSVRNELDFQVQLRPVEQIRAPDERVIVRNKLRLPVGWDCIEGFPGFDPERWKPEYAALWAENDILAAIVARQSEEAHYQSLDPNAAARDQFGEVLERYKQLLDSNPEREEILQLFLNENPTLLCPAHIKKWPKLPLGRWKTDFIFREAAGEYILVELERSTCNLFLKDGHASSELTHAIGQITDWKRYLEDNLATVQRELGLEGISANPRSMIVIGRSSSLSNENRRKLITMRNETPKLEILTYDDVYTNAKAVIENLLGPFFVTSGSTRTYYVSGS